MLPCCCSFCVLSGRIATWLPHGEDVWIILLFWHNDPPTLFSTCCFVVLNTLAHGRTDEHPSRWPLTLLCVISYL